MHVLLVPKRLMHYTLLYSNTKTQKCKVLDLLPLSVIHLYHVRNLLDNFKHSFLNFKFDFLETICLTLSLKLMLIRLIFSIRNRICIDSVKMLNK